MKACPCCGGPMPVEKATPHELLARLNRGREASFASAKLLNRLADRFGRVVSYDALSDACYGDDPNGGPENPMSVIKSLVCQWRHKLPDVGLDIETVVGAGYRMVWLSQRQAA